MSVEKIYQEYVNKYGERLGLFELLDKKFNIKNVLYPGSALHITPSFYFPLTVYIDTYSKAKIFFKKQGLLNFVEKNKKYKENPSLRYYPKDFTKPVNEKENFFDLLISLWAGFISKYCKNYLKIGGLLIANSSHGDASMASIDKDYEFFAVINHRNQKYYYSDKNLEQYFIPKKKIVITEYLLEKRQRGIGYTKTASLYLFRRIA